MNLQDEIKEAQEFYKLLTDETYLLNCDVEKETLKTVCEKFLNSPCSKTDFAVLMCLINDCTWDLQLFSFKFEKLEKELGLKKPSVSRSIKSLIENGFIEKAPFDKPTMQHYFFRTQYEVMKDKV